MRIHIKLFRYFSFSKFINDWKYVFEVWDSVLHIYVVHFISLFDKFIFSKLFVRLSQKFIVQLLATVQIKYATWNKQSNQ